VAVPKVPLTCADFQDASAKLAAEGNMMTNSTTSFRAGVSIAAITLVLAATPALAQAPDAAGADEIVVTGIRGALENSAKLKRASIAIVDSVSAEDIGKLPDVSIADSLARLPGVTAQRLEGRDQRLSIRGLGPEFGTTLLNGREQVTVGDNRGVEYDQYPSEFFNTVVVQKSADASLIAAGISGTVDLRMRRPLSQSKRVIALSARGQMNGEKALNPDSSRYGYRGSATFIDKFADDTIGIAIGVSAARSPSQNERYNAWGYPTDNNGNFVLGGAKPYVQSNELTRYGAVGTLEYEPSDNFHSTLDVLYSKFKETQHLRGIEFPLWWNVGAGNTVINKTVNGFDTSATFSKVHAVQRNDINKRDAENYSIGWNNVIGIGASTHLTVDASWSHSKRTDFLLETYSGFGYRASGPDDTVTVTQQPNGIFRIVPTLNYADTSLVRLTDPQGWGYNGTEAVVQSGFLNKPSFKDDLKSLRANLDGEFGGSSIFKGWEVGANYSRRQKTSAFTSFFLCPKGAGVNCTVASGTPTSAPVPTAAILSSTVTMAYLGVPKVLTLDPLYLYNNSLNSVFDNRPVSLVRDNTVTENIITGYAKLNLDGNVAEMPLRGNIGIQVVHSKQDSTGTISNFAGGKVSVLPASASASYTNILPSLSMSMEIQPNTFIKFGAAQTMVRARLDQIRVNQELNINSSLAGAGTKPANSPFSSSGGNTALRPYKSTNIDLSFERYLPKGGYFAFAGFFKHLTDYVESNNSFEYDFVSALGLLSPADQLLVKTSGTTIGLVTAPANAGGGDVMGFEATLQLPFSNISEALDGFGFYGSASYTDSTITLKQRPTTPITLPGLSDWVANAELYFEKSGFQARASYRYRSKFLGEVAGLSANPDFRQVKAEIIVDAQIGYEFQPGSPLAGLGILLQAKNLTDRPFITYQNDDPRQVIDYQRYGRDYYLGITYKF
jgi:iron complex outermembrane recepter protein